MNKPAHVEEKIFITRKHTQAPALAFYQGEELGFVFAYLVLCCVHVFCI